MKPRAELAAMFCFFLAGVAAALVHLLRGHG